MRKRSLILLALICFGFPVSAVDIHLDLMMPGSMFGPGSPFSLSLAAENTGGSFSDARVFVALTVGTGAFWFYPSWVQFPPAIDWEETFMPANYSTQWVIIPEFSWPSGTGAFEEATFLAAIVHDGLLVSNLAQVQFGWSEQAQPTPSPAPTPSATPTMPSFFVPITPGTFWRGSPDYIPCRGTDEGPYRQVTLTRGFYMMKTEVTRQMWAELKAVQPTLPQDPSTVSVSPYMDHPVQRVTWYEAILFANLMSLRDGLIRCYYTNMAYTIPVDTTNYLTGPFFCKFDASGYRLPTEAEWEYAARAGTNGPFSTHEPAYQATTCATCSPTPALNVLNSIAWWCGNASGKAHPAGIQLANPWGLHDMHGNVWEWCWDWYASYSDTHLTDPEGPLSGTLRVARGGSWDSDAECCRSASRGCGPATSRVSFMGFRLLRRYPI